MQEISKTALPQAACQLIPQAISIALSIRELIRQGYLFGALVLVRPLQERAVILLYLYQNPAEKVKWNRGWLQRELPNLSTMIDSIVKASGFPVPFDKNKATAEHNSIHHARSDCAVWTMMPLEGGRVGHMPSKMLNNPSLCDGVCEQAVARLFWVQGVILAYITEAFAAGPGATNDRARD
jgi:hypothetical protein